MVAVAEKQKMPKYYGADELVRYKQTGSKEDLNTFATLNIKLIEYVAHKFKFTRFDYADLLGTAQIGFMKAVKAYDLDKGILFATFACRCMENEILMLLRRERKHEYVVSLDKPLASDGEGKEVYLSDTVAADDEQPLMLTDEMKECLEVFKEKFKNNAVYLMLVEYRILKGWGQRKTAEKIELSQSYISRIEGRVLNELRIIAENLKYKEEVSMSSTTIINKAQFKYCMVNYKHITDKILSKVFKVSEEEVIKARKLYKHGHMYTIEEDPSIDATVQEVMSSQRGPKPGTRQNKPKLEDTAPRDESKYVLPPVKINKEPEPKPEPDKESIIPIPETRRERVEGRIVKDPKPFARVPVSEVSNRAVLLPEQGPVNEVRSAEPVETKQVDPEPVKVPEKEAQKTTGTSTNLTFTMTDASKDNIVESIEFLMRNMKDGTFKMQFTISSDL